MRQLLNVLIISVLLVGTTAAEEEKPASEEQIREWVEQLANELPPREYKTPDVRLTGEQKKSLEPVRAAFRELTRHFRESLPILVEHLDDKRYSYPQEHPTSGFFNNQTIGDACHAIIEGKVLLTGLSFLDSRDIGVSVSLPVDKEWYQDVSKMTLYEMQVDAIDRLLKCSKPERVTVKQWEKGLAEVRRFRKEFVRAGKAEDRVFGPAIEGK